jgi:hypothetical protein
MQIEVSTMPKNDVKDGLERSLIELIKPGQKPKDLIDAVRKRHPKISKKQIVRAAFSSLIKIADDEEDKARTLQGFALAERASPND